ncbi:MAG: hypothetical protein KGN79_07700 [Acidobacteriota bacterium]|nr:hypothetical protein [Acidobacteriota bacterium]
MNDLDRALGDISSIRRQVAQSTEFRGYGPATLAATGMLALGAALFQTWLIPNPAASLSRYLALWIATAAISATVTAVQMHTRSRRMHSGLSDEMIRMAVEQFLPAIGSGLLLTIVVVLSQPALAWLLPGLWQVIFGLGIFSSCRFLPRSIFVCGVWYLLTGLVVIGLGSERALSPWCMGISFAVGQLLSAAILFRAAKEYAVER